MNPVITQTAPVLKFSVLSEEKNVAIEAGYAYARKDGEEGAHQAIGALTVDVMSLKKYIEIPALKNMAIRIGVYAGYGRIEEKESELDYGIIAPLLKLEF